MVLVSRCLRFPALVHACLPDSAVPLLLPVSAVCTSTAVLGSCQCRTTPFVFGHAVLPLLVSLCESLQRCICVRWCGAQVGAVMSACGGVPCLLLRALGPHLPTQLSCCSCQSPECVRPLQ